MTTTPRLWKSLTQVNATDSGPNGEGQADGQIAALKDGGYVVVWGDSSGAFNPSGTALVAQRYSSAGNKVGGEVHLTNSFPGSASSPAVTVLANGNLAVAFVGDLFNFGLKDTFVQIFSPSLTLIRTDTIDSGPTQPGDPSITALANGGYAITYTVDDTQIVGRVVSPTGALGPGFGLGGSTHSELATLSNGNFVVVHEVSSSVTLEVFTPNADPVATVPGVDSGSGLDPDVAALRGGGFVVVWTDPASTGGDIRATIFSNDTGVPNFDAFQFRVNTATAGGQNEASVAALDDGGFLVTWENDNADLVRAQRFDAVGNKIGVEFTVKVGVSVDSPDVGVLSDGGIVFSVGDVSTGDPDVMTSIWTTGWPADPHVRDFNVDGWSDILWRNDNGATSMWEMNGSAIIAAPFLGNVSTDWQIVNTGDFNGDDRNDILWHNGVTGGTSLWEMNGGQLLAPPIFLGNIGTDWHIANTGGDFNGDGNSDILWRNVATGATSLWLMNGGQLAAQPISLGNSSPDWQIANTGDFNKDGRSDILWHNEITGATWLWVLNSNGGVGLASLVGTVSTDWHIANTGDFNGDGRCDILWRNVNTGGTSIWEMDGAQLLAAPINLGNVGTDWQIAGALDANNDGRSDILWRNVNSGATSIWEMNGGSVLAAVSLGNIGTDWHIVA